MADLFENENLIGREIIGERAVVLRGFTRLIAEEFLEKVSLIRIASPFRLMTTPGGHTMSVGLTNCGQLGWTSDRRGYRYTAIDPIPHKPWPEMPTTFLKLARSAALEAGFPDFLHDVCLNKSICTWNTALITSR